MLAIECRQQDEFLCLFNNNFFKAAAGYLVLILHYEILTLFLVYSSVVIYIASIIMGRQLLLILLPAVFSIASNSAAALSVVERNANHVNSSSQSQRRRFFLQSAAAITVSSWTGSNDVNGLSSNSRMPWRVPTACAAEDTGVVAPAVAQTAVPAMKRFVDNANPSYFIIDVPQRFFTIRRSAKGDLPDAQTGQGRRGGTIFTAGDMSKAEVVAVER